MNNRCVDCNRPTSGTRCRTCNGRYVREQTLVAFERQDADLLAEVAAGLTAERLAAREGVSRQATSRRIAAARRRQKERAATA